MKQQYNAKNKTGPKPKNHNWFEEEKIEKELSREKGIYDFTKYVYERQMYSY